MSISSGSQRKITNFPASNESAFGDLITSELDPVVQLDFVGGINIQTGVSTTANSATIDTSSGRLRLQSGTNAAGSAIFNSRRIAKYRPGQGMVARFTPVFDTPRADSTQIWGCGNADDGYFFGYNGTSFGILHRIRGNDNWITEANFNGDDYEWTKTFGSPVMIKYPYLGYGNVFFYVMDPSDHHWLLIHTIRYSNTTNVTQAGNPNLFFYGQCLNSGNTTNITMYCGSVGIFISGVRDLSAFPKWAIDNNKSGITTETNVISLRNATTYNGVTNRSLIRMQSMSIGAAGTNSIVVLRFKIGATVGGTPSFATINGTTANNGVTITSGNSIASYDTAGTTISGGTYIYNLSLSTNGNDIIDLIPYNIFIAPGETLTASVSGTASTAAGVSLNWIEEI